MYCSGCGNKLEGHENFCPKCGQGIGGQNKRETVSGPTETLSFSSSFVLGGNLLTPDRLIITAEEIIYKKRNRYLIGVDESVIPFKRISSVELNRRLISTTVIIYTNGNEKIELKNFSVSDAKEIRKAIAERINHL
ncbi:MAG TPA: PH domain-containing protein [Brumimicrobium sp.]|nr:PH domain-containing protein [Brumimicrobium sp.]